MAAVLPYIAPALSGAARTVSQRAMLYAQRQAPAVMKQATEFFSKQGKDIVTMAASKSPNTQAIVVGQMMKAGLPAASFVVDSELTADEARQYAQLINANVVRQRDAVDAEQTKIASTGDAYIDTVSKNNDIGAICRLLQINSDQYAMLIRCFNSHTSNDIERFQLDRRLRKEKFV